jgi:TPR repeat protein
VTGWLEALAQLERDPDAALDALGAAAPTDPEAALALGMILLEAEADDEGGLYWLAVAAEAQVPGARPLLARAMLQGRGADRPQAREAVRLLMAAARDGEAGAIDDLVELALMLDEALLIDAALGLATEAEPLQTAFVSAVRARAPRWFALHGEDLLAALR